MLRYGTVHTRRGTETSFVALGPDGGHGRAPVFLVHPINLRKECWFDLMRVLSVDRQCVAIDLAGHGESSDGEAYGLAGWVSDCRDVVTSLELDGLHLVGGSLGGTIALCLASELPDRALSVTALASSTGGDPPDADTGPDVTEMLDTNTVDDMFAAIAAAAVAPGTADQVVATVTYLTNAHGEQTIRKVWQASTSSNAAAWLPGVRCPVLVVSGELDTSWPQGAGQRMADGVGGRHEVLPGVAHLPMLEDVDAVVGLLVPHLESAEAKAGVR